MLKIRIEARAKCKRHPGYDPHVSGQQGIIGGCTACTALLEMYGAALVFQRLVGAALFDPAMPVSTLVPQTSRSTGEFAAPSTSPIAGKAKFSYRER